MSDYLCHQEKYTRTTVANRPIGSNGSEGHVDGCDAL